MARPNKTPLTYFPFATGFPNDDKIIILVGEFGAKGEAVVVRLWCALYGTYGYYLPYDEVNTPPTIARVEDRRYGVSSTLVVAIVRRAIQVGLFCGDLYKRYSILTSQAIQERYFHAVSRRRGITAIRQYLLIAPPIGVVIVDINPINVDNNELNKIRDNILPDGRILSLTERENNNFINIRKEKRKKKKESEKQFSVHELFFFRNFLSPTDEVRRFIDHYNARGWCDSSGARIQDTYSLACNWEQRTRRAQPSPHSPDALAAFKRFYALWSDTFQDEYDKSSFLSDIRHITADGNTMYISCTMAAARLIEERIKEHADVAAKALNPYNQIKYKLI